MWSGAKWWGALRRARCRRRSGVLRRTATGTARAFVTNVTVGTILRGLESNEGVFTIETLTSDTLFALFHGVGEWRGARADVRARAAEELGRRQALAAEASPQEQQAALVKALSEGPVDERDAALRALAKRRRGETIGNEEREALGRILRRVAEDLAREADAHLAPPPEMSDTPKRESAPRGRMAKPPQSPEEMRQALKDLDQQMQSELQALQDKHENPHTSEQEKKPSLCTRCPHRRKT